ncbi:MULTISPECIES: hybrid sensor histidine kinase/response regulator [Ralstonia]|jgi:two-component system capsular synthesis sensor histidine kinase RcsC|uniref:histidine kinase n=1 Tax=Ralstonia flaminis TaxID=3058597 RepID=A0ABN9JU47_9RALS|nr:MULTISPECIES: hybrid sensor histidine kinase/response regulator [unclassified Ralstonia]CAJ0821229.1 Sensor histidine kinase RcsC [Ralstonia sp. LMG 18101]
MPNAQSSTVLSAMRRFRRSALFGGGIVLTVMALLTFGIAVASIIRAHIDGERRNLQVEGERMASEVMKAEAIVRSTVYLAELVWNQRATTSTDEAARFRAGGGQLVQQHSGGLHAVLFASITPQTPVPELDRLIAMTNGVSRTLAATASIQGYRLSTYFYTPSNDFIAVSPFPWPDQARLDTATANRQALFGALTQDADGPIAPATLHDPGTGLHTVRWLTPYRNPLTGVMSTRMSIYGLDDRGKPFAVFVCEIPTSAVLGRLSTQRFHGTFVVLSRNGTPITTSNGDDPRPDVLAAVRETAAAKAMTLQRASNGIFTISSPPGLAGGRIVYAITLQDVLAGIWPQIRATTLLTAGLIAALWGLLWWFNRRVFVPMLERSESVVETERLNRMLVELAPIGLGVIDARTGEPMLSSPVMDEVASKTIAHAPSLSAEIAQRYAQRGGAGVVRDDDLAFTTTDGGHVDLAVSLAPARYRNTNVLVTAFTDVTDKKRTELALREAKQAADNANRAKSVFLATMSHEIRTPLNAILGNLELVGRMPLQPAVSDRLQTVAASSNALLGIINDVLDFSKIEAGQLSIESIPFDPVAVVREVAAIFAPIAQEKGLQFDCVIDDSVTPAYLGDPTRVRQIASNLLSNAIKFTDKGAVRIELRANDKAAGKTGITIGVIDSGIGINAEQQARLFEPFVQADSTITRRFGGSGLGLALCRRLVDAMGGTIALESTPGVGSRFAVTLPFATTATAATAADAGAEAGNDAAPAASTDSLPANVRVLAVDDQAANRELIRMQMEALGYRVDMADSGGHALRRFVEQPYDIVVTDLNMPGMDGYGLARCLRAQGAKIPIIALTAHAEVEEHRRCMREGIDAVLVKPVLLNTLDATLRRMLRTRAVAAQAPKTAPRAGIGEGRLPDAVLTALTRSTQEQLTALRVALSADDRNAVLRDLHAMKGTYAMIHEPAVSDACAEMEQQAQRGDDLIALQPALEKLAALTQDVLTMRSV